MGSRFSRMFRNYNIENRALREISKEKQRAAPRHPVDAPPPNSVSSDVVKQKNQPLLDLLRTVYVESRDPASGPAEGSQEVSVGQSSQWRPVRCISSVRTSNLTELSDVPKGKLTLAEALRALGSHQHQPRTWTPEKICQEYSLDLKEVRSALEFFVPFKVEIKPPQSTTTKQIEDS